MDGPGRREKGRNPMRRRIGGSGAGGGGGGGGGGGVLSKSSEVEWTTQELPSDWPQIDNDVPPLFSDDVGLVDTYHARFVHVDGDALKECCDGSYEILLEFAFRCYLKCALRQFTHPGENNVPGGLASFEGEELNEIDFYLQRASIAITQYNRLWEANLKLVKLLKVNFLMWAGELYYMTFTAYDEDTGKIGTYQAALKSLRALQNLPNTDAIGEYVLGLFIDCSTDIILACISITGAEEDLAAKIKSFEDARAGGLIKLPKLITSDAKVEREAPTSLYLYPQNNPKNTPKPPKKTAQQRSSGAAMDGSPHPLAPSPLPW